MLEIFKKLRGNANPTAAELRKALEAIDLEALRHAVDDAQCARKAALIDGDEKRLAVAEKALHAAQIALERAEIAQGELAARIEDAERREAAAALDAELAETEAEAAACAAQIAKRWPALQREMIELLDRLAETETRVQQVNTKLAEAGRPERVEGVEFGRARPHLPNLYEPAYSILARVALPDIEHWGVEGRSPSPLIG